MGKVHSKSDVALAVAQQLGALELAGVTHLPKRKVAAKAAKATSATGGAASAARGGKPAAVAASKPVATSPSQSSAKPAAAAGGSRLVVIDQLRQQVAACTRCGELADTRTQTVFGVGNLQARLMLFGEAPGADEDRTGEPFVGRAGQLLTKIIEACKMTRDDVYIFNVLKCRPPGNRTPNPDEVTHCRPFFERQIEIVQPEFICCLGTTAAQALLNSTETIGRLRGKFHRAYNATVICTYHPSYLLRNPAAKKDVWEDMKLLMREMGTPVD
jgi:DNA polymerase